MLGRRLLWQLFLTYLLIAMMVLVAISWYITHIFKETYLEKKISDLESRIYLVQPEMLNLINKNEYQKLDSLSKTIGKSSSTRITIILSNGLVIADSDKDITKMDNHKTRIEIKEALQGKRGSAIRYSITIKEKLLYVALPLWRDKNILGCIRVSIPITYIDNTIQSIHNSFTVAGIIIGLVIAIISFVFARWIRQPFKAIEKGIEKFARGDLQFRIHKPKSYEIGKIVNALNEMAALLYDKITAISEKNNEQQAVLESMVEGVLAVDQDEKIIKMNTTAARFFNVDPLQIIGRNIQEIIRNVELELLIKKILKEKVIIEEEIVINNKMYIQVHGTMLKNAQSEIMGALIVLNDVTHLRKLEQVRKDFVANVSHEIRTPLTSIKGYAETLLDGAINNLQDNRNFIEIIAQQADRMNAIIDDLLVLARLEQESGRSEIAFKKTNLHAVIDSAIAICLPAAIKKNMEIDIECKKALNIKINAALIEQAIVNLLDNAIKYNPENCKIKVIVEHHKPDSIAIMVNDNGVGIDKKHLTRLFERFYRLDKSRNSHLGGTGLGLAIVKHIAQVHSGYVEVESTPGAGSTFKIFIPY